jgi:hypothetical protein
MKSNYKNNQNAKSLISILPVLVYSILFIPMFFSYAITWLLTPIEPEKLSDLELI